MDYSSWMGKCSKTSPVFCISTLGQIQTVVLSFYPRRWRRPIFASACRFQHLPLHGSFCISYSTFNICKFPSSSVLIKAVSWHCHSLLIFSEAVWACLFSCSLFSNHDRLGSPLMSKSREHAQVKTVQFELLFSHLVLWNISPLARQMCQFGAIHVSDTLALLFLDFIHEYFARGNYCRALFWRHWRALAKHFQAESARHKVPTEFASHKK